MKQNTKNILKLMLCGAIVILLSFAAVYGANAAMEKFLDDELIEVQIAAKKAEEARIAAEKSEDARLKAEAERLKYEQMEAFYYHYYAQYYELFQNVYNADAIFIGTSHAAHGINPLYIEEEITDYSFFNFALNGSVPSFYYEWYNIFKNEAKYPIPKVVIYCVDWFMCDTDWLWRRISFDSPSDMPLGIMRSLKKSTDVSAETNNTDTSEPNESGTAEAAVEKTLFELLTDSVKENGIFDIDAHMTVFLTNTPIFSSRDRIPEMFKHFFAKEEAPVTDNNDVPEITDEALPEEIEMPVYEHEYLRDNTGNITSMYYKGYIPWEVPYGGTLQNVEAKDTEGEWKSFEKLLDIFEEDGIKVIFVQVPEYSGRHSGTMKINNRRLKKIAEEREIPFLNYNTDLASEINDDPSCYSDWGHMNLNGSTQFSKVLAEDLKPLLESEASED